VVIKGLEVCSKLTTFLYAEIEGLLELNRTVNTTNFIQHISAKANIEPWATTAYEKASRLTNSKFGTILSQRFICSYSAATTPSTRQSLKTPHKILMNCDTTC
jgi:hypothetical protein